jgi:hypothetical protein
MPGFDGTGPQGMGQMTGGGRGYCVTDANAYSVPGRRYGRGMGRGMGMGRGIGYGFRAFSQAPYYQQPVEDVNMLKQEASYIKEELDAIQKKINELESNKK